MLHGLMPLTLKAEFPNLYSTDFTFYVWLMLPILVAIVSQFIYLFLDKFFPRFLIALMGGRKSTAPKAANANGFLDSPQMSP